MQKQQRVTTEQDKAYGDIIIHAKTGLERADDDDDDMDDGDDWQQRKTAAFRKHLDAIDADA